MISNKKNDDFTQYEDMKQAIDNLVGRNVDATIDSILKAPYLQIYLYCNYKVIISLLEQNRIHQRRYRRKKNIYYWY